MTCKEKLIADHPDWDKDAIQYTLDEECPVDYYNIETPKNEFGYALCGDYGCIKCWERELSEIETKKENNMTTTKKTKAQLMEELETSENTVKDLKKQLQNLEKYKVYEDAGAEMKAIHTAFMNSGFSDDQAFELIRLSMMSQMSSITNANIRCDFNYDAFRKAARR